MASSASVNITNYAQDHVVLKCDICDADNKNEACHFCRDCRKYLCVSCQKTHKKLETNHKVVTPFEGRLIYSLGLNVDCLNHNKTFSYFCQNCDVNICNLCHTQKHSGHHLVNIEEHAKILKTELTEQLNMLEQRLPIFENKSDKVKKYVSYFDKMINDQISQVKTETTKVMLALEKQSSNLISDLKKEQETAHVILNEQLRAIDELMREVEYLTKSIKAYIDIAPDAGMLHFFNDAKTKIRNNSTSIRPTFPNPSKFTPSKGQLVGTLHKPGNIDSTIEIRKSLSLMQTVSLDGFVVSCTTDGSSCWICQQVHFENDTGKVRLVDKHGEQLLMVNLPHSVCYSALTSAGELLVSGDNTTKIARVTRQGKIRAFVDIKARGVECVSGLCTTQQDDVFVCVRMADDKTEDKVIKMSAQGEQILQVSQHLFTSNKLYGIHKISRDTFCVQDGYGRDQGSRLVILDAGGHLLRHINRTGELQTQTRCITGDMYGHIIAGTWRGAGYIHVCNNEGTLIHSYKLPGLSGPISCLSVDDDGVMWVARRDNLFVAKYLE